MTTDSATPDSWFTSSVSRSVRSLRRRVVATVLGSTTWLAFTLLYLGFIAHGFSLLQNVIVVLTSLVVLFGVVAALWISYGLGMAGRWTEW